MKREFVVVLAGGLLAATAGFGQSLDSFSGPSSAPGGGWYIDGYGELGYFDSGSDGEGFFRFDVDLGIRPEAGGIGFNLGVEGFGNESDDDYALYPTLSYGTDFGLFSVGVPRSVLDDGYLPEFFFAKSSVLDLQFGQVYGSIIGLQYLFSDDTLYGVRWDGAFGPTKVGVSAQRLDVPGDEFDALGVAFRHETAGVGSVPELVFFGGLEYGSTTGFSDTSYRLGVEGGDTRWMAGLFYSNPGDFGPDNLVTLYSDYRLTDSLTGSLAVMRISDTGSTRSIYGIGLQYTFLENGYVKAVAADSDSSSGDPIYELTVGYNF